MTDIETVIAVIGETHATIAQGLRRATHADPTMFWERVSTVLLPPTIEPLLDRFPDDTTNRIKAQYTEQRATAQDVEAKLAGMAAKYGQFDEYTLPKEGWASLQQLRQRLKGVSTAFFGEQAREMFFAGQPFVQKPELYKEARTLLEMEDFEAFAKTIPNVFPVRLCRYDHELMHGILPNRNGTVWEDGELSAAEYVQRVEQILDEGLRPSTNREHDLSDAEIPAVYFTADTNPPWGIVAVSMQSESLDVPIFTGGRYSPFGCSNDRDHLAYAPRPIKPKEGFKVHLIGKGKEKSYVAEVEIRLQQTNIPFAVSSHQ
jgi:hypothetical protein